MNILFFTQLFYPSLFGGGEYLFFLIAKELVKRGYSVHVITQRLSGTEEFEQVEGINIDRVGSEISYPSKEELLKEASPIKENVIFTQRVSHPQKVKRIAESSFMVFPSINEGFGIAIIEAFACKKPVLVSDIRPMSDIVKDNYSGFLISPFDEEEWANKMIYLFRNTEQQKRMGENAYQEFQSKYRIEAIITAYLRLYESLASHCRRNCCKKVCC
jgi:glycosyltransferase involved in cell wall biosynthesis